MTKRICILALIGLPATGKTTFSKWLLMLPQAPFNVIHLCYDDHLEVMTEQQPPAEFKKQRKNVLSMIQILINELKNNNNKSKLPKHVEQLVKSSLHHCKHGLLLICDDNNYYRSMRYKLYQISRQNECTYAQIYFDGTLKLAIERNEARPTEHRVPELIMQRMAERLEVPDPVAQHWETNTLLLSAEYEGYNILETKILEFLTEAFVNKLLPTIIKMSDDGVSVQSVVHQIDLLLRKRIGDILQRNHAHDALERQKLAKVLCDKRKGILRDVKVIYEKQTSSPSVTELNDYVNLLD